MLYEKDGLHILKFEDRGMSACTCTPLTMFCNERVEVPPYGICDYWRLQAALGIYEAEMQRRKKIRKALAKRRKK